jgi:hypothetical protein
MQQQAREIMTKKILIWVLVTFLMATVSLADAQQTAKVYRVGYLADTTGTGAKPPRCV